MSTETPAPAAVPADLSRPELLEKLQLCQHTIEDWQQDQEAPMVPYNGRLTRAISQDIEDRWAELMATCGTDRVTLDAKPIVLAVDAFADVLQEQKRRDAIHPGKGDPGGTQELWDAWGAIRKAAKPAENIKTMEPVAELKAKNTPLRQIALMYEWFDDHGQPDVGRVARELAEPGSETDVYATPTPAEQRRRAQIEAAWDRRIAIRHQRNEYRQTDEVAGRFGQREAPESIEDLIKSNVSSKQIALMKNVDQQTVIDLARQLGHPIDGVAPGPAISARQQLDRIREREADKLAQAAELARANAASDAERAKQEPEPPKPKPPEPAVDPADAPPAEDVETYAGFEIGERLRHLVFDGHSTNAIYNLVKSDTDATRTEIRAMIKQIREAS